MSFTSCCINALKVALVVLLTTSLVILVVALSTNQWVHITETVQRNNEVIKQEHEYGLFNWCLIENDIFIDCFDADSEDGPLKDVGRIDVKVWFILSAILQFIAVFASFPVVLQSRQLIYALAFSCVMGVGFCFGIIGLALFLWRAEDAPNYTIEWSFVLCIVSLVGCFIQIPLPCIIYIRSNKKTGDTKYLRQKFSIKDKKRDRYVAENDFNGFKDGPMKYTHNNNEGKYEVFDNTSRLASPFSTLNRTNKGYDGEISESGRSSALGITKDLFLMDDIKSKQDTTQKEANDKQMIQANNEEESTSRQIQVIQDGANSKNNDMNHHVGSLEIPVILDNEDDDDDGADYKEIHISNDYEIDNNEKRDHVIPVSIDYTEEQDDKEAAELRHSLTRC